MSGSKLGGLKKKLGLKGKTKPGEMISRMNKMKGESAKAEKGESKKKEKSESKGKIKKTGKFEGKSNKLGGGGRFAQVAKKAGGGKKGAAIAAFVGRKSLGKAKFQKLAAKGKKNAK